MGAAGALRGGDGVEALAHGAVTDGVHVDLEAGPAGGGHRRGHGGGLPDGVAAVARPIGVGLEQVARVTLDHAVGEELDRVGLEEVAVVLGALDLGGRDLRADLLPGHEFERASHAHGEPSGARQLRVGGDGVGAGVEHRVVDERDAERAGDRLLVEAQAVGILLDREVGDGGEDHVGG